MEQHETAMRAMVLGIVTGALMGAEGVEVAGAAPSRGAVWIESHGVRYRLVLVAEGDARQPLERG